MRVPDPVFLDWTIPTAEAAAEWLVRRAAPGDCVDLSGFLVLVSTRRAGRLLREAIACHAAPRGVLSPTIQTVAQWLMPRNPATAGPMESTLAAIQALRKLARHEFPTLLPRGMPFESFDEQRLFAREFLSLRAMLAEAGHSIESATERLPGHGDAERLRELATIEQAYLEELSRLGRVDRELQQLDTTHPPELPTALREIVLVAIADLSPLARNTLARIPEEVALHSLIPAPAESEELFDTWGHPVPSAWEDRAPGWNSFDTEVRLTARASDVATDLLASIPPDEPPSRAILEIGLLDRDLFAPLRTVLRSRGGELHNPEGEPIAKHWLPALLPEIATFLTERDLKSATDLFRNGAVASWLRSTSRQFDFDACLVDADEVQANHFPATAAEALRWCDERPHLHHALSALLDLEKQLRSKNWLSALREFLNAVVRAFHSTLGAQDLDALETAADATLSTLDAAEALAESQPRISCPDWLKLMHASLETARHYPEPPENSVDASGWLELQWSAAPHLVLSGFNQGFVPEVIPRSPFIGAGARKLLGLPTDEERAARDAYFLARLLAMRRPGRGRVDVQVLQVATDDSPRHPSPLLFAGTGDELPERVRRLFAEPRSARAEPPWHVGWTYELPALEIPRRIRVTGFARYLDCPFEFYLRFGLGMEPFDPTASEMDARIFGSLVHHALESFGRDASARDLTDPAAIRSALSAFLDTYVAASFSKPLSLPLTMQVESARRRLAAFATAQAEIRRAGWRIQQVEVDFADLLGAPWQIDGWEIRGRIDRIDVHEDTEALRILDYKTSDHAAPPATMHMAKVRSDWPPAYALIGDTAPDKHWTNLQLPLYHQLLVTTGRDPGKLSCGYFNLPKALHQTQLAIWEDFDETLASSAMRCARGVLNDIAQGRFWPPHSKVRHPEFAEWFEPSAEETIAADAAIRSFGT